MPEPIGSALTSEQAFEQLKELAQSALELQPEQVELIGLDTSLVEGLQLDSLKQVVLMASIEESFGFEFSPDDLDRIRELVTVGDLVRFLQERATSGSTWN
jgi:acyl carrier protein